MDLRDVVPLDVVRWSSEEVDAPAKALGGVQSALVLQQLLEAAPPGGVRVGWRSEKFCEYPQELVFRIVGSEHLPPQQSLVLVSHPTVIASRVEIFTSSTKSADWRRATFQRVGYVSLQSPAETQCLAQELKTIPLRDVRDPQTVTFFKLLVHKCHVHSANLFNQVGLVSVVVLSEAQDVEGTATISTSLRKCMSESKGQAHSAEASLALTTSASAPVLSRSRGDTVIWVEDRDEYTTATQILTRIQIARERHAMLFQSALLSENEMKRFQAEQRQWLVEELTCQELIDQKALTEIQGARAASLHERLEVRRQTDNIIVSFHELERRVHKKEEALRRVSSDALRVQLATSPVKRAKETAPSHSRSREMWSQLESWRAREEFTWKVVEAVSRYEAEEEAGEDRVEHKETEPVLLNEGLQIATTALKDPHGQVFVAGAALLKSVLTRHPRFHHATAWKQDVQELVLLLWNRLDDLQSAVRNNAAFMILQLAQSTRAGGSFVLHQLLHIVEATGRGAVSGQSLYGTVKVITALLSAFHCCATIDVSPKRVLRLIVIHDALEHENAQVREAARELLLAIHGEVGGEVVMTYLRKRKVSSEKLSEVKRLLAAIGAKSLNNATTVL